MQGKPTSLIHGKTISSTPALTIIYILYLSGCRPQLLLEEEFSGIDTAANKLKELFPGVKIDILVERVPLLLVEDVDIIVRELSRSETSRLSSEDYPS